MADPEGGGAGGPTHPFKNNIASASQNYQNIDISHLKVAYRIKPEELYNLSFGKGRDRSPKTFPQLRM